MISALRHRHRALVVVCGLVALLFAFRTPARAVSDHADYTPPAASSAASGRVFSTSFESASDFAGFFIVPQNYLGTTSHEQSIEQVHSGTYAHKAWIYGANPPSTLTVNNNHRGYPTVQLQKTAGGGYVCPCNLTFFVWLDMPLDVPGEWMSFATLTPDPSDAWSRTVLVNLSAANPAPGTAPGGVLHLMHVPNQGERQPTFQSSTIQFPLRQWVEIKIYIDFDPVHGEAIVWQDGQLVSAATVNGGSGKLEQAHFGMYAAPELASGVVFNDDLQIAEAPASAGGVAESPPSDPPQPAAASSDRNASTALVIAAAAACGLAILSAAAWHTRTHRT